jgi:phage terminase large subunit-like protein
MVTMMGHPEALEKKPSAAAVNPAKDGGQSIRPMLPQTMQEAHEWYAQLLRAAEADGGADGIRKVRRGLGKIDLYFLMTDILHRDDMRREWVFQRCCEVQASPNGHLDLWAREHYKSTIITFGLTIQDVLNNAELTVCIFSHTRGIAKGFLSQIMRELRDNNDLKTLYPDVLWADPEREAPKWSESDGIIVRRKGNPKEATIEAWGVVDGQPTSKHFGLRVYDDMVTLESVGTPDQIRKTTTSWEMSDNLGTRGGVARYIGTRYKLADTYAEMIERDVVHVRLYPATDNGRLNGNPVLLDRQTWEDKKKLQRSTVAAQMLQNPLSGEDQTFEVGWLLSYEVRPRTLNIVILVDPSKGRSTRSDRSAIAVIGIATGGTKYLLDGYCHRMGLSERWRVVRDLHKKWSAAPGCTVVSVGYERYGMQTDDEYFLERMMIERYSFPLQELNWTGDGTRSKNDRIERLEPDIRLGRFYIPLPVWRMGIGSAQWRLKFDEVDDVCTGLEYIALRDLTAGQREAMRRGDRQLLARAIKRQDENGELYDVTVRFIEEMSDHPYAQRDDLIDAVSRVYDMEVSPPISGRYEPPQAYFDS